MRTRGKDRKEKVVDEEKENLVAAIGGKQDDLERLLEVQQGSENAISAPVNLIDKNKENLSGAIDGESGDLPPALEVQESSENANNSRMNLMSDSEERILIKATIESSVTEKLPTEERFDHDLSSDALMLENEDIASLLLKEVNARERDTTCLPFQSSKGQKRLFKDSLDLTEGQNSLDKSDDILSNDFLKLKKQCLDIEDRMMKLEKDLMPRPDQPMNYYFNNAANILHWMQNHNSFRKDEIFSQIMGILGINEMNCSKYNKKTPTATARCLIRFKYPNPEPNFRLANVDKSIVDAIIAYTKYSNPYDTSSDGELRKAMNNYFSSMRCNRKTKIMAI